MKQLLFPIIAGIFIAGCASTPKTKTVSIESEPEGAHVFLVTGTHTNADEGRNFLGTTPFKWTAQMNGNGTFQFQNSAIPFYDKVKMSYAVFIAEPPTGATNLFEKREIFHSATQLTPADKVPEGIFFDLTKP